MVVLRGVLGCLVAVCLHAEVFFTPEMIQRHLEAYSEEEISSLHKDLVSIRSICFEGTKNTETPFYLATAGAVGSRKTTILERFVKTHPEYQEGVYLDPDPRGLRWMAHTYYAKTLTPYEIASWNDYTSLIQHAYNYWRGGSNFISLTLLEEAFALGRSVIYGTTSTGSHVPEFFSKLKENGYQIVLLLCSCPDDLRVQAVRYRNEEIRFHQSSPEDALSKGKVFPQKMTTYQKYADLIYLFWSDDLFREERLAAIWKNHHLEVLDPDAMRLLVAKYEQDREFLQEEGLRIPSFEEIFPVD